MQTKVCTKCGKELPLSEFGRFKHGKNGLRSWCKECWRVYQMAYRKSGGDKRFMQEILDAENLTHAEDILGGWKMYALDYAKRGESHYVCVHTSGKVFKTDKKDELLAFISEI